MRKETVFILAFLAVTLSTTAVIWMFAWPNLAPMSFPQVTSGTITVGPMRRVRTLDAREIADLNGWLQHHTGGWGPLARTPPSSGDARLELEAQGNGKAQPFVLTLWTGISAADWNDTVFVEAPDGSRVRTETFADGEFLSLRKLVDNGKVYEHSAFP